MPSDVREALGDLKGLASQWEADWREKLKEKERVEAEAKKKQKRPVWRCAVCGRYGCPVRPYIERYEEVDA
jgi:predicted metal-binding protein